MYAALHLVVEDGVDRMHIGDSTRKRMVLPNARPRGMRLRFDEFIFRDKGRVPLVVLLLILHCFLFPKGR